jgi:hypothetical protein
VVLASVAHTALPTRHKAREIYTRPKICRNINGNLPRAEFTPLTYSLFNSKENYLPLYII